MTSTSQQVPHKPDLHRLLPQQTRALLVTTIENKIWIQMSMVLVLIRTLIVPPPHNREFLRQFRQRTQKHCIQCVEQDLCPKPLCSFFQSLRWLRIKVPIQKPGLGDLNMLINKTQVAPFGKGIWIINHANLLATKKFCPTRFV